MARQCHANQRTRIPSERESAATPLLGCSRTETLSHNLILIGVIVSLRALEM
jgi:hypothetical protein